MLVRPVGANVFTSFPRLIVSIDWLKDSRAQSLLDEVLAGADHRRTPRKFDLLIVDEVHSIAPPGRGRYAVDSLRTRAVKRVAPHCEHRLFLSATPHNGYKESFTALLELLDTTFHSAQEVIDILKIPVIARVPYIPNVSDRQRQQRTRMFASAAASVTASFIRT